MEKKFGPANNGPISGRGTYFGLVHGRNIGPELNNRSENLGMSFKGAINKSGPCKHCHKPRHKEETCWVYMENSSIGRRNKTLEVGDIKQRQKTTLLKMVH